MSAMLRIDLDTLAENIARVRSVVAPADLMLVVKDDAYGHGLGPVVRRAAREGVRWFGAFDVATGAKVRETAGSAVRIFSWIAAARSEIDAAISHHLDLGIGDADLLEDVAIAAHAARAVPRIHLKVDTGLHRNGVRPEEWGSFVERAARLEAAGRVDVAGIWSHIAEASDHEDDLARDVFEGAIADALRAGLTPEVRHLSASAASFARPEFRYDLARVGAYCYGIRPAGGPPEDDLGVAPTARLEATVVAVDQRGVRLDFGALDGFPSSLSGKVSVDTPGGRRTVIAVEPDVILEPWPGAEEGDVVTIYGGPGGPSATDLAEAIGTIGEEIALRVSPIIPRSYSSTID
jgi:alanine racemase